jgi:hypothetical protein
MKNVARNILLCLMSVMIVAVSGGVLFTHHICRSHQVSYLSAFQAHGECHHEGVCCLPENDCCQTPGESERVIRHPGCCFDNHFLLRLQDFSGPHHDKQPEVKVVVLYYPQTGPEAVKKPGLSSRLCCLASNPPPLLSAFKPSFLGVFLI